MLDKTPAKPLEKNAVDPSSSKNAVPPTTATPVEKKKLPQLGALEDDDEFEDFPASAEQSGNVADALAKGGEPGDHLWEDNWDDDDVEDDFTKQLRTAIAERAGNGGEEVVMRE